MISDKLIRGRYSRGRVGTFLLPRGDGPSYWQQMAAQAHKLSEAGASTRNKRIVWQNISAAEARFARELMSPPPPSTHI